MGAAAAHSLTVWLHPVCTPPAAAVFGPGTSPSAATAPPPDQEAAAPPPIVAATSAAAPGAAPLTALSALVFMLAVLLLG